MKIKEVEQTANIAWSPASQYPIYLATGTAAQQLDASFSTTSQIDLYSLDLNEPGLGMGLKASISTKQRYISVSITIKDSDSTRFSSTGFTNWCGAHRESLVGKILVES